MGLHSLPAEALTVARYLAVRAGDGPSIATSAIARAHEWAKQESPCRDQGVRASLPPPFTAIVWGHWRRSLLSYDGQSFSLLGGPSYHHGASCRRAGALVANSRLRAVRSQDAPQRVHDDVVAAYVPSPSHKGMWQFVVPPGLS